MLTKYIEAAMKLARYEIIEDGTYWGEIPDFEGVWGNATTLEECREDLRDALEGWLALKLWLNDDDFPVLGRLALSQRRVKSWPKHATNQPARTSKAS
jgi:predicted RNase H-like HicB family nuclease